MCTRILSRTCCVTLAALTLCPCLALAAADNVPDPVEKIRENAARQGYVVQDLRWDPVLKRTWVVLKSATHPERPSVSVLSELAEQASQPSRAAAAAAAESRIARPKQLVVHAGDRVLLWSEENNMRLQVMAIAEDNGGVGDKVHLRIEGTGWGGDQPARQTAGTVRGPAEVEMEQ